MIKKNFFVFETWVCQMCQGYLAGFPLKNLNIFNFAFLFILLKAGEGYV